MTIASELACGESGRDSWREERLKGVRRRTKGAFCSLSLAGCFITKRLTLLLTASLVPKVLACISI